MKSGFLFNLDGRETIPAITICQPYASLVMLPDSHDANKRAENRTWRSDYRGPLAIHAGRSRSYLDDYDGYRPRPMPFGVVLGVVDMIDCVHIDDIEGGSLKPELQWLEEHEHACGPWCFVLANPRPLTTPVAYSGQVKLWQIPVKLLGGLT